MNASHPLSTPSRGARAMRTAPCLLGVLVLLLNLTGVALAQGGSPHQGDPGAAAGRVPALPKGSGRLVVEVAVRGSGAPAPGVDVALYALSPDGTPGLGSGTTDAAGRFAFEGISNDPAITYLAGASYAGVPFGQRVAFEPDRSDQTVRIEVIPASVDGAAIVVGESRIQIGWLGRHLLFEVTHLLRNPGETVRMVPDGERDERGPLFEAALPDEFVEFAEAVVGFAEGLERDGTSLRYFGPVYPGQQELRYRFTVAVPEGRAGTTLLVALPQPRGSGRVTVVTPASGPMLHNDDALGSEQVELDGVPQTLTELAAVPPGSRLELALDIPASRSDVGAIAIPRADYWLDHDDAVVTVQAQIQLEVTPGPHVQGTPDAPLLHIDLPPGAELKGVSASTQALGVGLSERGGLDLVGPVPSGASSIEFGYDVPADGDGGATLDLRVDQPIGVVNVLIADHGLAVESDLLHRRRPFRQGTRNYLHRRAFQVGGGEAVDVRLVPLDDQAAPRSRSTLAVLVLGAGAVWFLVAPLRRRDEPAAGDVVDATTREREMIYESIRDLDLDLDTGKIDSADHAELRARLRDEAIELVRRQRRAADAAAGGDAAPPASTDATGAPAPRGAFCPGCGGRTEPDWRFCSHCGGGLAAK